MSYAIVRNEKLIRDEAKGRYVHNERKTKGHIKSNSIILCEMIFTSDKEFFDNIGEEETKRYFRESYKFVCDYKNLGEENIISAVVHLDEGTPHMHLVFVPVVHTKDKEGNEIDKIQKYQI